MLLISEKPYGGFYFIKVGNVVINGDNPKILACILQAYQLNPQANVFAIKYKLGATSKVSLIDLRTKKVENLDLNDWQGLKINYPFAVEFECEEPPEELLKQIPRDKGLTSFLRRNLKKVVIYSILLVLSLGMLGKTYLDYLHSKEELPKTKYKPVVVKPKKVAKKTKPSRPKCLTNIKSFVENFVVGAKVKTDPNTGEVYMVYEASKGEKIKQKLILTEFNHTFAPEINTSKFIVARETKFGLEFLGADYDLCLDFIRKNLDKPLYIISLDEKGCDIILPKSCFYLAVASGRKSTAENR
jgi:hypothetical protein